MLKVYGLGNILRGDDGIGPFVIRKLQEGDADIFKELKDAGSDPFLILENLLESDPVLVIDCAKMGLKPGCVRRISARNHGFPAKNFDQSLHGYRLSNLWQLARKMGVKNDLIVIGVEPQSLEFNTGLSAVVINSIPAILQMVREEAIKNAQKNSDN
jgi:hydrogenase maturation protease